MGDLIGRGVLDWRRIPWLRVLRLEQSRVGRPLG